MNKVRVDFANCDLIEAENVDGKWHLSATGCSDLLNLINSHIQKEGHDIVAWTLPQGHSHVDMLVRELILKAGQQWHYPYQHEELCHCRMINTKKVDEAILMGAHHSAVVSRQTSASTACGTCRPDVEKLIEFRMGIIKPK